MTRLYENADGPEVFLPIWVTQVNMCSPQKKCMQFSVFFHIIMFVIEISFKGLVLISAVTVSAFTMGPMVFDYNLEAI